MARFEGMNFLRSKGICCLLLTLCLSVLTGCGVVDKLRPELNQMERMRVDPSTIVIDFDDVKKDAGNTAGGGTVNGSATPGGSTSRPSGGSGGGSSGGSGGGGNYEEPAPTVSSGFTRDGRMIVDPSNFAEVENSVVSAADYSRYLQEKVYDPIMEILNELDKDQKNGLYLRVMHAGYNQDPDSGVMKQAPTFDKTVNYGCSMVGGAAMSTFATEWLQQLPYNQDAVTSARNNAMQIINNFISRNPVPSGYSSWYEVDWLAASSNSSFPKSILKLWGNDRVGAATLGDYIGMMNTQSVGVVPNVKLKVYKSASGSSTVLLNKASTTSARYQDGLSTTDINTLFTGFNQFANRSCDMIDKVYTDDSSSLLYSYLDGYNKTMVYLSAKPGVDLPTLLGPKYAELNSIITSIQAPTSWQVIQQDYPDLHIVAEGSRGAD